MKVKPQVSAKSTLATSLNILKLGGVLSSPVIVLLTLATAVSVTYLATAFYLAPDKLKIPLASWAHRNGYFSAINKGGIPQTLLSSPVKFFQFGGAEEIPRVHVDIKFKHLQKLREKRNEALRKGILNISPEDYVPASIRHGNQTTKVKLRLKGDLVDHLQGEKWSFRVHVKKGEHLFGLRRFSLQAPWTRGFHSEVLFLETVRRSGILTPRYFFVEAVINGNDIGLMALEEHFSKELLEHNGRREGVIVKFDESLFWENNQGPVFHNYRNVPIKGFRTARIKRSEKLSEDYATAVGLLRSFINNQLPASEVFDAEKMGSFLATAELWGASHAMKFNNLRLYFNPISLKLEPISFDASIPSRDGELPTLAGDVLIANNHPLARAILKDPKVGDIYFEAIERLAHDVVDGDLIEELKIIEQKVLPVLTKEFLLLSEMPLEDLTQRAKSLLKLKPQKKDSRKNHREPDSKTYPLVAHTYLINDAEKPYLEIANAVPYPVGINSVEWISRSGDKNIPFRVLSESSLPEMLPPTPLDTLPQSIRIYFSPIDLKEYWLKVSTSIQFQDKEYEAEVRPYFPPISHHPIPSASISQLLNQHPFLTLDTDNKTLRVRVGKWSVKGSLIVPSGYSLSIEGNTILQFSGKEGLIANGPLFFQGTEESPILLEGQPDGHGDLWQGIAVLNSKIKSKLSFVTIRNTSGISRPGWELTGGTTFYKSDVEVNHSSILGHRGEDALNIVQSEFILNSVKIEDASSDGFDADFAKGVIEGGMFKNIGKAGGGDGVDVNGSQIAINGTLFQDISDKGISVGEQSIATVSDVIMEGVATGAASKDGSQLTLTNATLKKSTHVGLIAYMKKPEYGPATIDAKNIKFKNTPNSTRVQTGSSLTLEGNLVKAENIDVEQYYNTIMKPGLK